MRKIPLATVQFLVVLAIAQIVVAATPHAVVVEPIVDVGIIAKGKEIAHTFTIRNEGDAPLLLTEVKPSCGCTVAEYDEEIAPGGSGTVRTVVETVNFDGPIAKSVSVYTNDVANPRLQLVVKANIRAHVDAQPGFVRFIHVLGEPAMTSVQVLSSTNFPDLVVQGVKSPYPFLQVAVDELQGSARPAGLSGRAWGIQVTMPEEAPIGPLADYLTVAVNHPQQKEVRIPVSGFVRPILAVTPAIVDFGKQALADPYLSTLEVRNLGTDPVDLLSAETGIDSLEVEIEPREEGRLFKILLTLKSGLPKGDFSGVVRIRTTSARQPVLEIDVRGSVI